MKNENKKNFWKKAGVVSASIVAIMVIVSSVIAIVSVNPFSDKNKSIDSGSWHTIGTIDSSQLYDYLTAENSPDGSDSGWLSTFCLDYAETPGTCLASNATNGAYDGWGNVSGYIDTDDTDVDLASEDPFYFVVRCRFNTNVKSGSDFMANRCRCTLNVTGDETIDDVILYGHDDDVAGGGRAVISWNETAGNYIYINFVWDDNSDGYQILDDGSLDWSIVIEEKY